MIRDMKRKAGWKRSPIIPICAITPPVNATIAIGSIKKKKSEKKETKKKKREGGGRRMEGGEQFIGRRDGCWKTYSILENVRLRLLKPVLAGNASFS